MADVRPLAALRYDPARVGEVADVIAPPYDVITPEEQEALYARSPWNVIRLILPREADRGVSAARTLRAWVDERVLVRDPEPALYLYAQEYTLPDGSRRRRDGVLCRLRLETFSRGVVRPHERTLPGPKADRLRILRATGANLSAIFGLYARPGEAVRDLLDVRDSPLLDLRGGHRLWRVTDPARIARFTAALANETIVIADGHHRYETALAYRDEQRGNEAAEWVLAYLANMEEEGVVILPTHRLVTGAMPAAAAVLADVAPWFEAVSPDGPRQAGEIDFVDPGHRYRFLVRPSARDAVGHLSPALRKLDLAVLHELVLGRVLGLRIEDLDYTHDDADAVARVRRGEANAAFLLNAPTIGQVRDVCFAGELMPEKSTYFYPKLASGLVFSLVGPPWA
jgi:uncharacterized protein (DUF1015 family)